MDLPTSNAVRDFLVSMGDTEQAVYEWLKANGIMGTVGADCPIVRALRRQFPDPELFINATYEGIWIRKISDTYREFRIFAATTAATEAFMRAYDQRIRYQDLREPDGEAA